MSFEHGDFNVFFFHNVVYLRVKRHIWTGRSLIGL